MDYFFIHTDLVCGGIVCYTFTNFLVYLFVLCYMLRLLLKIRL